MRRVSDGLRRGVGRGVGLRAQVVEQLRPHLLGLVEAGETLHDLGVAGLRGERLPEEHDGLAAVVEADLVAAAASSRSRCFSSSSSSPHSSTRRR